MAKILYAEDEITVRDVTSEIIGMRYPNYDLEVFKSGDSLVERLNGDQDFNVVITDNDMPGIKGLEIIRMYALKLSSPFILFYGGNESIGRLAVDYGAYGYARKPDSKKLFGMMNEILKSLR